MTIRRSAVTSFGVAIAFSALGVSACGLLFDVDSLGSTAAVDAGDAGSDAVAEVDAQCAHRAGGPMINAGGSCIDATKVTVLDYDAFRTAMRSAPPPPKPCDWLTSFEPPDFAKQLTSPNLPVVNVNWCQAFHYCAWAGKRLCGDVRGGAVAYDDAGMSDPKTNQWLRACTHEGERKFPWGNDSKGTACPESPLVPVGSRPFCEGGYPGLFDMIGNGDEWVDGCDPAGRRGLPEEDDCPIVNAAVVRNEGKCSDYRYVGRYQADGYIGFRCCGP